MPCSVARVATGDVAGWGGPRGAGGGGGAAAPARGRVGTGQDRDDVVAWRIDEPLQ